MSYHFISGLPRSGSTLLAGILQQNPCTHASIISPLGPVITNVRSALSPGQETHIMWTEEQQLRVIEAIFDAYYADILDHIIFDSNRRWCADISLLAKVFPNCKVICCVREPAHIVDSFERLFRASPIVASTIIQSNTSATMYDRVAMIMRDDHVVGYALNVLREALAGPERERILLLEYLDLVQHPKESLERIHQFVRMPPFEYDFDKIEQIPGAEEFDRSIGLPPLHTLQPKITCQPRKAVLTPDIIARLPAAFWR